MPFVGGRRAGQFLGHGPLRPLASLWRSGASQQMPLLSGGARISSARFRDELIQGIPAGRHPVIGGDMEAVGLLAVTPADRPLWIVVKAIADFAQAPAKQTDPERRASACRNAAQLVVAALQNDVFDASSRSMRENRQCRP